MGVGVQQSLEFTVTLTFNLHWKQCYVNSQSDYKPEHKIITNWMLYTKDANYKSLFAQSLQTKNM